MFDFEQKLKGRIQLLDTPKPKPNVYNSFSNIRFAPTLVLDIGWISITTIYTQKFVTANLGLFPVIVRGIDLFPLSCK